MPQEDKFKKQVDQLARALAKALADLTGAQTPAAIEEAMSQSSEIINENPDPTDPGHLMLMADLLYEMAEKGHPDQNKLYQKAKELYQHLNSTGDTWSMEWQNKIDRITKALNR